MPEPTPDGRRTPAIVLGVESQIGLAIVRELGRAGVPVIAISHDPRAIGLVSRHVWRPVVVGPPRSDAVIQSVNALCQELGPLSLLTVSEGNLMWLDSQRGRFDPWVKLAVPTSAALRTVLDKSQTLTAAQRLGIAVPRTEQPQSMDDIEALCADFPFPAVLKWADGNAAGVALAAAGLELVKAEYVYSADELRRVAARYAPIQAWPLVQQYCAGQGLGQFFFVHEGRVVRRFQHLRIAEWPPEGGYSSVCDSLPLDQHAELQRQSAALLQEIGWEGVAMVEYRWDPANGRATLMEINGRFWGSFPLAVAAGAGFALFAHNAALGLPLPALAEPAAGRRCRMVVTELKRLVRIVLQPGQIRDRAFRRRPWQEAARFVADYFRPRVSYFVWDLRDPRPFWRDVASTLARVARRPPEAERAAP